MTRDVVIIGAGPQGLAVAAHLTAAGVDTVVFGHPLEFWRDHMPRGMFLRSSLRASSIADPCRQLTLESYSSETGSPLTEPLPLDAYLDYGDWFMSRAATPLDRRLVKLVKAAPRGFRLTLEDDFQLEASRVIVAAGITPFAYRPAPFSQLSRSFVSHSFDHADLARFTGRSLLVVGAGQSALESAALLAEHGARVEVLARAAAVRWLDPPSAHARNGTTLHRLQFPPTDVGPRGLNWLVAAPDAVRRLPAQLRRHADRRCITPAGADWLVPRLASVTITTGLRATTTDVRDGQVLVELDDGSRRAVDHVLLATGYDVDVARYPFLDEVLVQRVQRVGGYPVLAEGLQSSFPRLHFVGAPAAFSFGPVMRFVCGAAYAARAVCDRVLDRRARWNGFSW